jgi:hypothetical protein
VMDPGPVRSGLKSGTNVRFDRGRDAVRMRYMSKEGYLF